ncbi:MAG TPA: hypothetical protein VI727_07430 [Candidatus Brocadiaceae bacterium]|nr:hypothetical protein [Candidatus Brocadiaceae bacterium]
MLAFQLFRIKVYPSPQLHLMEKTKSPSEILKETIDTLPYAELRKGMIWHIGNVSPIDENGLYFRVGRTTKSKIEVYQDGNFVDEEFETAPYTHLILDISLEVCAIAGKSKLSPKTTGIANQFIRLLNESNYAHTKKVTFEIDEINDPEDFVSHLKRAYAISKFWVTFSKPNPFDVNEDFYKPMEKLLKASDGAKGKTELGGSNLKSDSLEDLARTAASTGNEAGAWLQPEQERPKVKKLLKGNPVGVSQEDVADEGQRKNLLQGVRDLYRKVRGRDGKQ